jgi:DNA gyrase/topoisomerase IV subunit A
MMDVRESQNRVGRATTYGRGDGDGELLGDARSRFKSEEQLANRKEQRKRFQFEAAASDDELEDELDGNLDEIGDATKRLKALGMAMGQELDDQKRRIDVIEQKAVRTEEKIILNTERVCQILPHSRQVLTPSITAQEDQVVSMTDIWRLGLKDTNVDTMIFVLKLEYKHFCGHAQIMCTTSLSWPKFCFLPCYAKDGVRL